MLSSFPLPLQVYRLQGGWVAHRMQRDFPQQQHMHYCSYVGRTGPTMAECSLMQQCTMQRGVAGHIAGGALIATAAGSSSSVVNVQPRDAAREC